MSLIVVRCRYDFHLEEDDSNGCYRLEVDCPRFMDTSLMDCDVQPTYVRVSIKDKVSRPAESN